jgi:hypothetical protein
MGIIARGVGGDGPGFQLPSMSDVGDWFGGAGGGAAMGGAAGGAIGGLLGGIPGMLAGGLAGGAAGGAVGGNGIMDMIGGAASTVGGWVGSGIDTVSDWAGGSGIEPWMLGTGGPATWPQGGADNEGMYLSSDRDLKRDLAPITGALSLL